MKKAYKNYLGRNFKKRRTPDKISKARRSRLMSKIRSKNTAFETKFVKILKKEMRAAFLNHVRSIRGNPDIVFEGRRACVFLDSDFWHGWQYPRWKHLLKSKFWRDKIEANRRRDRVTTRYLTRHGWRVLRIWEHQINKNTSDQIRKIRNILK